MTFRKEPKTAPRIPANVTASIGEGSAGVSAALSLGPPVATPPRASRGGLPVPAGGTAALLFRRAGSRDFPTGAQFDRVGVAGAGALGFDEVAASFFECFSGQQFSGARVFERRLDRLQPPGAHPRE